MTKVFNNVWFSAYTSITCITQTIVAHATARGISLESIKINLEGGVDIGGWAGILSDVRLGTQGFKVNVNIKSDSASEEQINELYEIGKKLSPAFDTLRDFSNCCEFIWLVISYGKEAISRGGDHIS